MSILKGAADLVYTIRFLKLLTTDWEDTEAYKAGIIDDNGKVRRDFKKNTLENRKAYEKHYTAFHRLVFNVKRLLNKAPGGRSRLASYAAALFLIKENGHLSNKNLEKIHSETGVDTLDLLSEETKWFMIEGNDLSPGVYRMKNDTITTKAAEVVFKDDKIRIHEDKNGPVGSVFGINIYEATHLNSQQQIYVSTGEITR